MTATTLYIDHERGLQLLHPLTVLAITVVLAILSMVLPGMWPAYFVFLLGVVPLALWSGVLRPLWSGLWKIVLPFAISMYLIQGLFWTGGTPVVDLGPLSLKAEGLIFATTITGRLLAMTAAFLLFSLVTRPDDLMISLEERGVPNSITYITLSAIQLIPVMQARANKIRDAQQARGLEIGGSFMQRIRSLIPLIEPLVLGSIIEVDERAIALEARGFSSETTKTFFRTIKDPPWERILRWALIILSVLLIIARIFWPFVGPYLGSGA